MPSEPKLTQGVIKINEHKIVQMIDKPHQQAGVLFGSTPQVSNVANKPLSNSNKKYIDSGVKDDRKINYTLIKQSTFILQQNF